MEIKKTNLKRRLIALALSVVMLFSMVPASSIASFAQEGETQPVQDTTINTNSYDEPSNTDEIGTEQETGETKLEQSDETKIITNVEFKTYDSFVYPNSKNCTPIQVVGIEDGDIVNYYYTYINNENEEVQVPNDNGQVTLIPGTYTGYATVQRENYEILESDKITIEVENGQILLTCDSNNENWDKNTNTFTTTYTGDEIDIPKILIADVGVTETNGVINDVEMIYTVVDDKTIKNAGTYTINVIATKDYYDDATATYQVVVNQAEIDDNRLSDVTFTAYGKTYDGEEHDIAIVKDTNNALEDYTVYYKVGDDDWTSTMPQITEAGSYNFKVKIALTDDSEDNYTDYVLETEFTANIEKAEQSLLFNNFEGLESNRVVNTNNKVFQAVEFDFAANSNGTYFSNDEAGVIEYSIEEGDSIAIIDSETGKLEVTGAGKIKVKATIAATNNYAEYSIIHTLIVKAEGTFISFDEKFSDYILGTGDGVVSTKIVGNVAGDDADITYNAKIDDSNIGDYGLKIVATSGKITIEDYSEVVSAMQNGPLIIEVTAEKSETDYYSDSKASYKIEISFLEIGEVVFDLDGTINNGWYNSSVTVSVEGYNLAEEIDEGAAFNDELIFSEDGEYDKKTTYLQDTETGAIADEVAIKSFKIDATAPKTDGLNIVVEAGNGASWNTYDDEVYTDTGVTVTLTACEDALSGLDYITWFYENADGSSDDNVETVQQSIYVDELTLDKKTNTYSKTLTLDYTNSNGSILLKATDKAGNSSDHAKWKYGKVEYLVIDKVSPTITVIHEYVNPKNVVAIYENESYYYKDDVKFTIEIEETNFDSSSVIVKAGDVSIENVEWSEPNTIEVDTYTGTFTLTQEDSYDITIGYADKASNDIEDTQTEEGAYGSTDDEGVYTLKTVVIDKTAPTIQILTDMANQEVTFKVVDDNFDASKIEASIKALDIKGESVLKESQIETLISELKHNWTLEETESGNICYTFTKSDFVDANYTYSISLTDMSGNETISSTEKNFAIDKTAPENISITYEKSIVQTLLEKITFGFYNPSVKVEFTANDQTTGVDYFDWDYTQFVGTSSSNLEKDSGRVYATVDKTDLTKYSAEVTLPADIAKVLSEPSQYHGYISVSATDKSEIKYDNGDLGNISETKTDNDNVIVVDTISPKLTITYSESSRNESGIAYYNDDVNVTLDIIEANFYEENINVYVSQDGKTPELVDNLNWITNDDVEDGHTVDFKLEAAQTSHNNDGDYVVYVSYKDYSKNAMIDITDYDNSKVELEDKNYEETVYEYASHLIVIDTISPVITVEYDIESTDVIDERKYYAGEVIAKVTVEEHNFKSDDVEFYFTECDVNGLDITGTISQTDWATSEDIHTMTITYSGDANYTFDINYDDLACNSATYLINNEDNETETINNYVPDQLTVDKTAPTDVEITYSESFVDRLINAITFGYYKPSVDVTFTAEEMASVVTDFEWLYTQENGTSAVNVETDSGKVAATLVEGSNSKYSATITLSANDVVQYRGNITATATNNVGHTSDDLVDIDNVVVVDTISPEISVCYKESSNQVGTQYFFNENIDAIITIDEANFYSQDVVVTVTKDGESYAVDTMWENVLSDDETVSDIYEGTFKLSEDGDYVVTVSYLDRSNNKSIDYVSNILTLDKTIPVLDFAYDADTQSTKYTVIEHNFDSNDLVIDVQSLDLNLEEVPYQSFISYLRDNDNWIQDQTNTDLYTIVYDAYSDSIYNFDINYLDLAKNEATTLNTETFVIDHTAPDTDDMTIEYSTPIFSEVLSKITFGYYNPDVEVTFTAVDPIAGVSYLEYIYTKSEGSSEVNEASYQDVERISVVQDEDVADKTVFTATITLPANEIDNINGHISFSAIDKKDNASDILIDTDDVIVVDTITPEMTVEYTKSDRLVDNNVYYNNDFTATLKVTEANFDVDDVIVTVSKDAGEAYEVTPKWTDESVDIHIGTLTFTDDADYIINVTYTDKSNNEMTSYTSKTHTIDTIDPVIDVSYDSKVDTVDVITDKAGDERTYYSQVQTATITINEHNFDSSEVLYTITAADAIDSSLDINSLISKSDWTTNGDNHTMTITYSGDANYTFDVAYTDLATNESTDYAQDYLTIDKTAPTNLSISYSTSVLSTILEALTFGFYDAKVKVTISANDATSSVYDFVYSYINADGVSTVNAELIDEAISCANISYNGYTATSTFEIPKAALSSNSQFNGTIEFTANDRSDNKTTTSDDARIVVDNIAPVASIEFSSPVSEMDGISYYDGDINVSITMDEANFYPSDIVVIIASETSSESVTPSWSIVDADTTVGTFTISGDGEYFVTVNYSDKSGNAMKEFVSNELVIDTQIETPIIKINGVEETQTAYKDEVVLAMQMQDDHFLDYDYNITYTSFAEKNIDITDSFKINTSEIDEMGGNVVFQDIEKLAKNDGIYEITVSMTDKSGHSSKSSAVFTVNRYGSVYEYSDYLVSIIENGGAFIQLVEQDLIITEYNADKLVADSLSIEITLDGKPIDNVKYDVSPNIDDAVQVGDSGWYQYEYAISASNFEADGIYKISVSSEDATGNSPENSNYENMSISFAVDTQAPEITSITGLEENIINLQEVTISYIVYDTSGIDSIAIYVDGEQAFGIIDTFDDVNNYEGEFVLNESSSTQNVRIVVTDLAGNVTDTQAEDFSSAYVFNSSVTISTNAFVRWYANSILFWSSISGTVVLVGLVVLLLVLKKKKKNA